MTVTTKVATFTAEEVLDAYNRAANDIEHIDVPEGEDDYRSSLLVHVGFFYLTGKAATVEEAVSQGWPGARVEDGRLHVAHESNEAGRG